MSCLSGVGKERKSYDWEWCHVEWSGVGRAEVGATGAGGGRSRSWGSSSRSSRRMRRKKRRRRRSSSSAASRCFLGTGTKARPGAVSLARSWGCLQLSGASGCTSWVPPPPPPSPPTPTARTPRAFRGISVLATGLSRQTPGGRKPAKSLCVSGKQKIHRLEEVRTERMCTCV